MPYFRYRAVNGAGETIEGEVDAPDRAAVIDRLHRDGNIPIRADAVSGSLAWQLDFRGRRRGQRLTLEDVALISQEFATLLRAGLPADRTLTILSTLADKPAKRRFAGSVLERIRSGATLSDALEQQGEDLPSYYVGMVRAGEASNNLAKVFARLAELLNRTRALRESVKSALYYPLIVLVVASATMAILLTVVVPQFRPLFESSGAALPLLTRVVIAVGDVVKEFWWVGVLASIGFVIGVRQHYARPSGRLFWDRRLLNMPIFGPLVIKIEVARFARTLGTLLGSGVVELSALSIATSTVTNRAVSDAISAVGGQLKRGDGWALPLRETGIFPDLAVQIVQVGEESGQLHEMLIQVADVFDEDVQRTIHRMLGLLVPVVTIVLGIVVAAVIAAMLMAILSTYTMPI